MAHAKVTDADLRAYLDVGHSQADAARHFGVSEPAVHQRLKRLRQLTSRVVALEQAGAVVEEKLSATARLERVQQVIDGELAWAVGQARQPGADRGALADVILKLAGEVRQQLGLQLAISRTLVDLQLFRGIPGDCDRDHPGGGARGRAPPRRPPQLGATLGCEGRNADD
jgi:hypothetical protein